MKIAVFLDVDKTLTKDYIQSDYAKALNCAEEYYIIETNFQEGRIDSEGFGIELCKLFAKHHFSLQRAFDEFASVKLQSWADQLLTLPVDKYLVSSGPSYYIDELARRYGIPPDNVIRSQYDFDTRTSHISHCSAVDEHQKADFVRSKVAKYDITVGIGDHPTFDGPFVSHCTIQVLTNLSPSTLYAQGFPPIISLINKLRELKAGTAEQVSIDGQGDHARLVDVLKSFSLVDYITIAGFLVVIFSGGYGMSALVEYVRSSAH